MVFIGQKILREKRWIDVMTQLKTSGLKAHGRKNCPEMEAIASAVDEPNAGAVLRAAMVSRRSEREAARQVTWTMTPH